MKYTIAIAASAALIISATSCKDKTVSNVKLNNNIDSMSYALGVSIGENFANMELNDINYELFIQGIKDHHDSIPAMELMEAEDYLQQEFQKVLNAKNDVKKKAGQDFMAANATKEGVQSTASGLQYKVITEGTGIKPGPTDSVTVHYRGTLMDGTEFDSSLDREPVTFALGGRMIPGWVEGLQLMSEGSKYMIYIPQELGYGSQDMGDIKPFSPLIFEVELIKVIKK